MKRREKTDFKLNNPLNIIVFGLLILYVVSLIYPLIWGFISSFKSYYEFRLNVGGLPKKWVFDNYITAITKFTIRIEDGAGFVLIGLPEMFLNSIIYSVGMAFFTTLSHLLAAYATAKYSKVLFSKILTAIVLFVMILPIVGNLPSAIQLAYKLRLHDKMVGSWIRNATYLTVYFLILQGMIAGIPKEFDEAAKLDGASNLDIMLRVNLPLLANILQTLFLLNFIAAWNDFREPMVFLPTKPVVSYGLYIFFMMRDNATATVPMKLTATMLLMIPMIAVFMVFHKRIMGDLTAGGIKG